MSYEYYETHSNCERCEAPITIASQTQMTCMPDELAGGLEHRIRGEWTCAVCQEDFCPACPSVDGVCVACIQESLVIKWRKQMTVTELKAATEFIRPTAPVQRVILRDFSIEP